MEAPNNPTAAWIILAAVVAFFIFVAAWMIYKSRHWDWPKGRRVEGLHKGFRATLVYSAAVEARFQKEGVDVPLIAKQAARAAWSLHEAWKANPVDPSHDAMPRLSHTVVMILTDEEFEGDDPREALLRVAFAATLGKVGRSVGGAYLPMTITRYKHARTISITGEPHIHEMAHQVVWDAKRDGIRLYDYEHADERVWVAAGGSLSLQGRARAFFQDV